MHQVVHRKAFPYESLCEIKLFQCEDAYNTQHSAITTQI